jgi:hypothetical protein
MLAGNLMAGWQLARSVVAAEALLAQPDAGGEAPRFLRSKIATARFYADHILSRAPAVRDAIVEGAESVTALPVDAY